MKREAATIEEILHGPQPKMKGVLEFGHKTGGSIVLVPAEKFEEHRKRVRRGSYGTNLKRYSR